VRGRLTQSAPLCFGQPAAAASRRGTPRRRRNPLRYRTPPGSGFERRPAVGSPPVNQYRATCQPLLRLGALGRMGRRGERLGAPSVCTRMWRFAACLLHRQDRPCGKAHTAWPPSGPPHQGERADPWPAQRRSTDRRRNSLGSRPPIARWPVTLSSLETISRPAPLPGVDSRSPRDMALSIDAQTGAGFCAPRAPCPPGGTGGVVAVDVRTPGKAALRSSRACAECKKGQKNRQV